MFCGYSHWTETRLQLSDCVNEQYRGLRAFYVCNRHRRLHAVSEYNSTTVWGSLLWISTEHRLGTAGFRLLYFFKFLKSCLNVYCSTLMCSPNKWPLTGGHPRVGPAASKSTLALNIIRGHIMMVVPSRTDKIIHDVDAQPIKQHL